MLNNLPYEKIYCIGIGGIGVAGLAELLHRTGYQVAGSDVSVNDMTRHLASLGVTVYDAHRAEQVVGADLVVYTSAVSPNNPELLAAKKSKIPTLSRGELLAQVMQAESNIIVTGTHGKTTTSGIISCVFEQAGVNPTCFVGGVLRDRQSPFRQGDGRFFIAEADESDASFLFLSPTVAVITNIDADHMETYAHDFERLKKSFLEMAQKIPAHGFLVACGDDPVVRALLPSITCRKITYGADKVSDYRLSNFRQTDLRTQFQVHSPDGKTLSIELNLPGIHNALNAMAAIIVADQYHLDHQKILLALKQFPGVGRRFQFQGEISVTGGKALLFDDYGHHPIEIRATLKAARLAFPSRRLVLVFQPHRYSRTRDLMHDFATVLNEADMIVLTEVYAASEEKIKGADGAALFHWVKTLGAQHVHFLPLLSTLPADLRALLKPNDVVILQGAGDIVSMVDSLLHV